MLERIREGSQGVWAMAILGLVILSFVFAGVGSYINSSGVGVAANVNGEEITLDELEKAYQNERARMEQQYGDSFATLASDAGYLQNFRSSILDRLIGEKLMDQAAAELGLRVSDEQIKSAIVTMTEFQIDGKFDNERYLAILRQAGYQPTSFRDYMRVDMVRRQLSQSLLGTEFALENEAQSAHLMQQQTRDLRYATLSSDKFTDQVDVTEQQISSYYQANISQFDTEEKVSLEYVEMTLDDVMSNITVTEQELAEYYQQNIDDYRTAEERQASHILFESADEDESVLALAESVLDKVQAGGDFAELAKEYSSDTFSAENGGDLGWFGAGIMDPAFEEAAFALAAKGDVSAVVKSEFGYHIIKLTDIKPEQVTAYADVQDEVSTKLKTFKAEEEFYGIQQRIAEVAFELPDSLEEVAAEANKPILTTEPFTRLAPPEVVASPNVLSSAFSDELIVEGVNSEVLELGRNHIMVVRVASHEEERTKALDEVSEQIKSILLAEASQQAARDWIAEVKSKLVNGEDTSAEFESMNLTWQDKSAVTRNDGTVSRTIVEAAFKLAEGNVDVVDLVTGDVSLVQLIKVNSGEAADDTLVASLQNQLASLKTQNLYAAVIQSLRAEADIDILQQ
ncbi:SurA N-terminal domain-containing protein [Paraglaciecola aquimarina]|uniref:Periplasmic chaperone PpiD n=1 Tax=Paraglaciecola aquimarina TaxID=1235557 RepID=A0ABU3SWL5_9ALTE|nr:SurA N-terminal domain-containing protein [Paraglaciecola aquimarina]MDU0354406.1 SurA N-terminal domain-containing protein [Paraglaciecola aquimarina]